ncbi:MAG TPA: tetratricopeptide repeat protein [Verrucomicrobiae bacterium]|nr:tetratricopeptide repeat protein [Verrucomicrobiae bacterium]
MISIAQGLSLTVALGAFASTSHTYAAVSFSRDIAPIIFENCASCHRPGQSAPFPLLNYADVKKHANDIVKVTADRSMPPWLAEKGTREFIGERRLSSPQIESIAQWAAAGAPEGDARDLPVMPTFPPDWQLGPPDLIVKMPKPYILAPQGSDLYRNFVVAASIPQTRFVRAIEFQPRNRAVHHVRIKLDSTRQSRRLDEQDEEVGFAGMKTPGKYPAGHLLSWVPGLTPRAVDQGLQWPLEKETDLVFEIHLQRTGKEELIDPELGLYFTNSPPSKSAVIMGLVSQLIDIPAGETNYVVEREVELPVDCFATTVLPHMHYLAKECEVFAALPHGARESLLRIPNWDFNWQGEYRYKEPVLLPAGSKLTMRTRFDNSEANIRNPNHPPRRVVYGPQSTDEMCEVSLQLLPRQAADLASLQKAARALNDKETIALYEKRLQENPRNAAVHTALGKVLGPMGRMDEALRHFQTAVDLDPAQAEAHLYLGLALLEKRDVEGAQREFEATLKYEPSNVRAHTGLGLVALRRDRPNEAQLHFEQALRFNPDDPAAKFYMQKLKQPGR